jgi:hypothetical protein
VAGRVQAKTREMHRKKRKPHSAFLQQDLIWLCVICFVIVKNYQ